MDVRSLRRKRITIILLSLLTLSAVVGGVYVVQKKRIEAQAATQRAEGLAAFEAEQYPLAVERLKPYVETHVHDTQAWYAFGRSCLLSPTEHFENVGEALRALRHVVGTLAPDHLEAAHDLLELEVLVEQNDRALALTEQILKNHPDDTLARRMRILALARLNRNEEAWQLAGEWLQQRPQDLEIQLAVIQLRYVLGHSASAIIGEARDLTVQYPDDPRYPLMLGTAMGLGGQEQEGLDLLRAAAARPMPSDVPLSVVISLLDQVNLYDESLQLLQRQVTRQSEPALVQEKIRRCFEAGLTDLTLELIGDPASPALDVRQLALGAMAAMRSDDPSRAQGFLAALRARADDPAADAWAQVLDRLGPTGLSPGAESVTMLRDAVARTASNGYLYALLGDALFDSDEPAQAAAAWQRAAELRPSWDTPHRQLARYNLSIGQVEQAGRDAEAAFARRPTSLDNALVVAQARAMAIQPGDAQALDDLLELLDNIDQSSGLPQRTLLLRATVLATHGRADRLRQMFTDLIEQKPDLPPALLAQLIALSREYELDTTDALRAMAGDGDDPHTVLDRALELVRAGRADEAIKLVDQHRASPTPAWDLARVRVLEAVGDPALPAAWKKLAEDYPGDPRSQVEALRSEALAHDTAAAEAIIDRLRKLGGEEGSVWRVEKARWILRAGGNLDAVLELLREALARDQTDVDARVLTAFAHRQAGRLPLAARELQTAVAQRPDALNLRLELAAVFQQLRSYDSAAEQLNHVALNAAASPMMLRRAAMMLAQQGADLRAIAVLEDLSSRRGDGAATDDLLLASLYRRNDQSDLAEAACRRLLDVPTPEGLLFVAAFYATSDRGDQARQVLDRINSLDVPADVRHGTLASYHARFGSPDDALAHYRAAVEAAPADRDHRARLVAFELTIGEIDAALADAAGSEERTGPATLARHGALVKRFAAVDRWRGLVISIIAEPADQDVAVEALSRLAAVPDEPGAQADAMRELIEAHRGHLALQLAQTRALIDAGRGSDAAELAVRTMYGHPTSVDAAWLAAETLSAQQRWSEALVAASQWRQRSAGQTMGADLIVAEARLQLNDVQAALREVLPHLDAALARPAQHPAVISAYARILVADGRADEARRLLRPLLEGGGDWRMLWARLAALAIPEESAAKDWLNELKPHISQQTPAEQVHLAQAWWTLFLRSGDAACRQEAAAWIDRVIQRPDADAQAWLLKGIISEVAHELADADRAYRRALELDATMHNAANNLAMVVLQSGGDSAEATRLAEQAVQLQPSMPDYLDTLAQVLAKAGQYDQAINTMKRAIDVDPGRAAWQWNLLDLYEAAGQQAEADRLRDRLRLQFPLGRPNESAGALQ